MQPILHCLRASLILLASLLLVACGSPGIGSATVSPIGGSSTNYVTTLSVIIELNSGMRADLNTPVPASQWDEQLFAFLTPSQAHAFTGIGATQSIDPGDISVVELDADFTARVTNDIPNYEVVENDGAAGGYLIKFEEQISPQINHVIRVRLGNGKVLYGPMFETGGSFDEDGGLENAGNPIYINIGTHYIIKTLFEAIPDAETLNDLLPCPANSTTCNTQYQRKNNLLSYIAVTARDFSIDFDSDLSFDEALELLEGRIDFASNIEAAVNEIVRSSPSLATGQEDILSQFALAPWSKEYHSSYFSIGLNNYDPDGDGQKVQYSSASSTIIENSIDTSLTYPNLVNTSFIPSSTDQVRYETLVPELPFLQDHLVLNSSTATYTEEEYPRYFSATSSSDRIALDTFMSDQGFVLFDRSIGQQIPNLNDDDPVDGYLGVEYSPVYSKLYQSNQTLPAYLTDPNVDFRDPETNEINPIDYGDSPTWLSSAYLGGGSAFQLGSNRNNFSRDSEQERYQLFTWEVHGLYTDDSPNENTSFVGREYGAVNLAMQLDDDDPLIDLQAHTFFWEGEVRQFRQSQPDGGHYQSHLIRRNIDDSIVAPAATNDTSTTTRVFNLPDSEDIDDYNGRMRLDQGSQNSEGHVSQNTAYMSFVQHNDIDGKGLILASELRTTPAEFGDSDTPSLYLLQGNWIQITADSTAFINLGGSSIAIEQAGTGTCDATLSLQLGEVRHTLDGDLLASTLEAGTTDYTSVSCTHSAQGEVAISFNDLPETGKSLTLKGFMTHADDESSSAPGNLMNLLWVQDDALGLVFAHLDQNLNGQEDR